MNKDNLVICVQNNTNHLVKAGENIALCGEQPSVGYKFESQILIDHSDISHARNCYFCANEVSPVIIGDDKEINKVFEETSKKRQSRSV